MLSLALMAAFQALGSLTRYSVWCCPAIASFGQPQYLASKVSIPCCHPIPCHFNLLWFRINSKEGMPRWSLRSIMNLLTIIFEKQIHPTKALQPLTELFVSPVLNYRWRWYEQVCEKQQCRGQTDPLFKNYERTSWHFLLFKSLNHIECLFQAMIRLLYFCLPRDRVNNWSWYSCFLSFDLYILVSIIFDPSYFTFENS